MTFKEAKTLNKQTIDRFSKSWPFWILVTLMILLLPFILHLKKGVSQLNRNYKSLVNDLIYVSSRKELFI